MNGDDAGREEYGVWEDVWPLWRYVAETEQYEPSVIVSWSEPEHSRDVYRCYVGIDGGDDDGPVRSLEMNTQAQTKLQCEGAINALIKLCLRKSGWGWDKSVPTSFAIDASHAEQTYVHVFSRHTWLATDV